MWPLGDCYQKIDIGQPHYGQKTLTLLNNFSYIPKNVKPSHISHENFIYKKVVGVGKSLYISKGSSSRASDRDEM